MRASQGEEVRSYHPLPQWFVGGEKGEGPLDGWKAPLRQEGRVEGTAGVGFWSDSHFRLLERVTSQTVTARVWRAALLR